VLVRNRQPLSGRQPWVLLAGILVVAAVVITWMGRDVSLIGDQWAWIFAAIDPRFGDLFHNYNGHLMATTYALYDVLPRIGLTQLWIYRAVALVLHLIVAYLVFCLARRRLGPALALVPTLVILFLGTGADAYLSGVNYNELAATAACLGALLALERQTPRGDVAASALLVLGVASFSNAIAFAGGVAVEVLFRRAGRLRRLWIPLVPVVLYGAWRLHWGSSSDVAPGGPLDVIRQSVRAATGAFAGLAGVQLENFTLKAHLPWLAAVAQIALAVLIVGACTLLAMRRFRIDARLANLLVTGTILWVLIGLGRSSQEVYASRYVYEGGIIALLIIVELAAVSTIRGRIGRRLLAIAIAVSVVLNIGWMAVWGRHLRQVSDMTRAQLAALEIAGDAAPPSFGPDASYPLARVTAGEYFAALRAFGRSPAYTPARLRQASAESREAGDGVLIRAFSLRLQDARSRPASDGSPAQVEALISGRLTRHGRCFTVSPRGKRPAIVAIGVRSPSGVTLKHAQRATQEVGVRRFGDRYQSVPWTAGARGAAQLLTPLGRVRDPWHVRVTASTPTEVCS
jgi:hypothetical protein